MSNDTIDSRLATLEAKALPLELIRRNALAYEEAIQWQTNKIEEFKKLIDRQSNIIMSLEQRLQIVEQRSIQGLINRVGTGPTTT